MRVMQSKFTKTNPKTILKPGGGLGAPVLDLPLLRPKEFYRAGIAPPPVLKFLDPPLSASGTIY